MDLIIVKKRRIIASGSLKQDSTRVVASKPINQVVKVTRGGARSRLKSSTRKRQFQDLAKETLQGIEPEMEIESEGFRRLSRPTASGSLKVRIYALSTPGAQPSNQKTSTKPSSPVLSVILRPEVMTDGEANTTREAREPWSLPMHVSALSAIMVLARGKEFIHKANL